MQANSSAAKTGVIKSGDQLVAVGEVDIRDMKPAAVGDMLLGEEVVPHAHAHAQVRANGLALSHCPARVRALTPHTYREHG